LKKITVLTLVGTRPEIIKLSQVIKKLDQYTNHILVHSGQNFDFELNELFFEQLNIRKPDYFLEAIKGRESKTIGDIISKVDSLIAKVNPDAFLIYGDTNSCLGVIAAKKRKVPIFHMEAGNRSFDERIPEEANRRLIDHLSDINLPLSNLARSNLIREGIKPETVIKTGSPMLEVLNANMAKINSSNILNQEDLIENNYFIISIHRAENVDSKKIFDELLSSINTIAEKYCMPIIISTHPRTRKKLEEIGYKNSNSLLNFSKPFGFHEYIKLQMNAFCIISDSGSITEEASILNLPAITIRQSHERPEGMDEGTLIMSGLNKDRIIQSIELITKERIEENTQKIVEDYNIDNVSSKVLRIILSYIDYINRNVWQKDRYSE
jgi:UDP-N-acetylglucosamine 2-epimerase (non-hydrolysing)